LVVDVVQRFALDNSHTLCAQYCRWRTSATWRAIEIGIVANNCEVVPLRHGDLIGVVKIQVVCLRRFYHHSEIRGREGYDRNSGTIHVRDEIAKIVVPPAPEQSQPNRINRETAHVQAVLIDGL